MNTSSNNRNRNRSNLFVATGLGTLAVVALAFGQSASAGGEPIEPVVPDLTDLPELPDPPITLPDDLVAVPLPDDPEITVPDDFAPGSPGDPDPDPTDPDPTVPVLPESRCEAEGTCPPDPTDPTPGTPQGSLPQTGGSTVAVAGVALAATTAGAFLCLAAGRRNRFRA
jgi:hypothetical protein